MAKVVIVGAGVNGLFSAYYLSEAGVEVEVIDQGDLSNNCSYGNAGMIVPSHIIPLAHPGVISKGLKWLIDRRSPFYIRPTFSFELINWVWSFYRSSTHKHVNTAKRPLLELSLFSKSLYQEISSKMEAFDYQEKGLLMCYQTSKVGKGEREAAEIAKDMGVSVKYYSNEELHAKFKSQLNLQGAIHYTEDAHLNPSRLMQWLKEELTFKGVTLSSHCKVNSIESSQGKINYLNTNQGEIEGDCFLLAAGAESSHLFNDFGVSGKMVAGKGYSFEIDSSEDVVEIPSILCEGKLAITPFKEKIRIGGTMEITTQRGKDVDWQRIEGMKNTFQKFYPNVKLPEISVQDIWVGNRPCSSNGLPIIGKSKKFNNSFVATGHGMMGLSLGAATGKIIQELIMEKRTSVDIALFSKDL